MYAQAESHPVHTFMKIHCACETREARLVATFLFDPHHMSSYTSMLFHEHLSKTIESDLCQFSLAAALQGLTGSGLIFQLRPTGDAKD